MHFFHFYSCSSNLFCLLLFFGAFFHNFFNVFEISVKFCVFDTFFNFFKKNIFFRSYQYFFQTLKPNAQETAQKIKKRIQQMCLRFQFCTHQRVCILYFLKKSNSLYPSVHLAGIFLHPMRDRHWRKSSYDSKGKTEQNF